MKNDTVLVKDRRHRRSVPSVIGEIATHLALIVMLAFVLVLACAATIGAMGLSL